MWKAKTLAAALVLATAALAGCVGPNPYRSVDLQRNLDQAALERYESEWQALPAADRAKHEVVLEHSNWWPLGIIAYHRDSSVTRMAGPAGPVFQVTSGHGFGPLSLLYSVSTHATYTAKGERENWMRLQAILKGCLAMAHDTNVQLADGRVERSSSWHLVHHIFNVHTMDGHSYISLLTVPNPIGVSLTSQHGE